jgi:dethiobiotin synthetase
LTRRRAGLFVTATDTGVGKTLVACELIRRLRELGVDACGMKPVETGVGSEGPLDGIALRSAAGDLDALEEVCPQRFPLPAAPAVAASRSGACVDLRSIHDAFDALSARHECVIVEGAGGLLVPIADGFDMADLARELDLPLLVVARARLGTINHTLLTLSAARTRGLAVAGVVICHAEGALSQADSWNLAHLKGLLGRLVVGEVPYLVGAPSVPVGAIDFERVRRELRLSGS